MAGSRLRYSRFDEPAVDVDVGAKDAIHELIWDLAKYEGKSIILISSAMPEIVTLTRRIPVFKDFEIVGEIDGLNAHKFSYDEGSQQMDDI